MFQVLRYGFNQVTYVTHPPRGRAGLLQLSSVQVRISQRRLVAAYCRMLQAVQLRFSYNRQVHSYGYGSDPTVQRPQCRLYSLPRFQVQSGLPPRAVSAAPAVRLRFPVPYTSDVQYRYQRGTGSDHQRQFTSCASIPVFARVLPSSFSSGHSVQDVSRPQFTGDGTVTTQTVRAPRFRPIQVAPWRRQPSPVPAGTIQYVASFQYKYKPIQVRTGLPVHLYGYGSRYFPDLPVYGTTDFAANSLGFRQRPVQFRIQFTPGDVYPDVNSVFVFASARRTGVLALLGPDGSRLPSKVVEPGQERRETRRSPVCRGR